MLARDALNAAQETERATLAAEQAIASLELFENKSSLEIQASLKEEQVRLTDKLLAAQLAARHSLEAAQMTTQAALEAEYVLSNAIEKSNLFKEVITSPPHNL